VTPAAVVPGTYRFTPTGNLTAGVVGGVQFGSGVSLPNTFQINVSTDVVITDVSSPNNFKILLGGGNNGTGLTSFTVRRIA
jgi:hypothetical protein